MVERLIWLHGPITKRAYIGKGGGGAAGAYKRSISSVYRLTGPSIAGGGL